MNMFLQRLGRLLFMDVNHCKKWLHDFCNIDLDYLVTASSTLKHAHEKYMLNTYHKWSCVWFKLIVFSSFQILLSFTTIDYVRVLYKYILKCINGVVFDAFVMMANISMLLHRTCWSRSSWMRMRYWIARFTGLLFSNIYPLWTMVIRD